VYLDSSALVKLVIAEPESPAPRRYLGHDPERASCVRPRSKSFAPSVATAPQRSPGLDDSCGG
jgi:hypothetical protein